MLEVVAAVFDEVVGDVICDVNPVDDPVVAVSPWLVLLPGEEVSPPLSEEVRRANEVLDEVAWLYETAGSDELVYAVAD